MFAFVLAPLLAAAAPNYGAACPMQNPAVARQPIFVAPENIHPTYRQARFLIDVGSDGKVRRVALTQSTGDATFDDAALTAAKNMTFLPPSQGCISTSFTAPQSFQVPLISLLPAHPAAAVSDGIPMPGASASPAPAINAGAPAPNCASGFVDLVGLDIPDHREAPGTVSVDVHLNAAAKVTSVLLASSSGNKKTDYAATSAARTALYKFADQPGCKPTATVYRLELTYH